MDMRSPALLGLSAAVLSVFGLLWLASGSFRSVLGIGRGQDLESGHKSNQTDSIDCCNLQMDFMLLSKVTCYLKCWLKASFISKFEWEVNAAKQIWPFVCCIQSKSWYLANAKQRKHKPSTSWSCRLTVAYAVIGGHRNPKRKQSRFVKRFQIPLDHSQFQS